MKEFCVDLKIAKELHENGFPQKSYFSYGVCLKADSCIWERSDKLNAPYEYSAPIADEILKEIPNVIIKNNKYYYLNIFRDVFNVVNPNFCTNYHEISYIDHENKCLNAPNNISIDQEQKMANALAKMWLYLKKENLICPKKKLR